MTLLYLLDTNSAVHLGVRKNLEDVIYLGILREFCSQGKVGIKVL